MLYLCHFWDSPKVSTCRWVSHNSHQAMVHCHASSSNCVGQLCYTTQQLIPLRYIGETHFSYERSINKKQLVSGMHPPFFSIFLEDKELRVLVPYVLIYIYYTTINPHEKECFQISGGLYYHKSTFHKSTLVHRKATVLWGLPDVALCNLRKRQGFRRKNI